MIELFISSSGFWIFRLRSSTLSWPKGNTSCLFANICGVVSNPEASEIGLKFSIAAHGSISHQNLDNCVTVSLFSMEFLVSAFKSQ